MLLLILAKMHASFGHILTQSESSMKYMRSVEWTSEVSDMTARYLYEQLSACQVSMRVQITVSVSTRNHRLSMAFEYRLIINKINFRQEAISHDHTPDYEYGDEND